MAFHGAARYNFGAVAVQHISGKGSYPDYGNSYLNHLFIYKVLHKFGFCSNFVPQN